MDGQEVNVRIVGESIFWQMESETAIIVQTQKGQETSVAMATTWRASLCVVFQHMLTRSFNEFAQIL